MWLADSCTDVFLGYIWDLDGPPKELIGICWGVIIPVFGVSVCDVD